MIGRTRNDEDEGIQRYCAAVLSLSFIALRYGFRGEAREVVFSLVDNLVGAAWGLRFHYVLFNDFEPEAKRGIE